MGDAAAMPLEDLLRHLERLANESLPLWPVPEGARARLINVSENATYLVEADNGFRSILRIHRPHYHSRRGIEQELAWSQALAADNMVQTPPPIPGRNGELVQEGHVDGLPEARFMVMFTFAEGHTSAFAGLAEAGAFSSPRLGCRRCLWPESKLGRLA